MHTNMVVANSLLQVIFLKSLLNHVSIIVT